MSTERPDIAQINQYLQGRLDNPGMYELERAAQSDPFVMDALDGFVSAGRDQKANLDDLKDRLEERVAPKKKRSILQRRVLPIAACLLLMLGAGYWFYTAKPTKLRYANVIQPHPGIKKPADSIPPQIAAATSAAKQADRAKPKALPELAKAEKIPVTVDKELPSAMPDLPDSLLKRSQAITTVQDNPVGNAEQLVQGKIDPTASKNLNYGLITVMGVITEVKTGEPLTGTSIGVPGKSLTQADVNGKYSVTVPVGTTLVFNEIGYGIQSIELKPGQVALDVKLAPNNMALREVVIRGYVKRNREETTGSSYIITGKEVQDHPVGNVEQLLQGKVAGLNIQNNKTTTVKPVAVKPCTENTEFKDKFLENIATAERYNFEHAGGYVATISNRQFRKALKFIAKYVPVSVNKDAGLNAFRADKEKWLSWYEDNKCNGLK